MNEKVENRFMIITQKRTVLAILLLLSSIGLTSGSYAANITQLKIFPEHVGVFTEVQSQQFVAFGFNSDTNTWDNITTEVSWNSSSNQHVTIDDNGLATVQSGITNGIVRVSCTYPKGATTITPKNTVITPILQLLD